MLLLLCKLFRFLFLVFIKSCILYSVVCFYLCCCDIVILSLGSIKYICLTVCLSINQISDILALNKLFTDKLMP